MMFARSILLLAGLSAAVSGCSREKAKSGSPAATGGDRNPPVAKEATKRLRQTLRLARKAPTPPAQDAPHEAPLVYRPALQTGSWSVRRPVAVYSRPDTASPIVGGIAKFTRLPRTGRVPGRGCAHFLYLAEGAYVCTKNLRPTKRPPRAKRQPGLGANKLTPGTYGYIRTGGTKLFDTLPDAFADRGGVEIKQSDTVRWAGKRFFRGKKFWFITTGKYVRGDRVRRFWPSRFAGVRLLARGPRAKQLPLVFMVGNRRRRIGEKIPGIAVHAEPGGKVVAQLPRYSAWPVSDVLQRGQVGEDRWYQIPGKGWVSSEYSRLATFTDPPKGLHPAERWIDVDLSEQVIVAYRGRAPVFTTLVAPGVWKFPTPKGVFRITSKRAEANMKNEPGADETYRVDHVPWTMYFKRGYALHGTYWHDGFGHARSHGCVNLSPRDARLVYEFTRPALPDGWTYLVANKTRPGTVLRIRGAAPRKAKGIPSTKAKD